MEIIKFKENPKNEYTLKLFGADYKIVIEKEKKEIVKKDMDKENDKII